MTGGLERCTRRETARLCIIATCIAAQVLPDVAAIVSNERRFGGRYSADLAGRWPDLRVFVLEESKRLVIRADRQVLVDQIEHPVRTRSQVWPQILIGRAQQAQLMTNQTADWIDGLPVLRALARIGWAAKPSKHGDLERAGQRRLR